ncbi:MAG: nitroreductase [Candidatus Methanoperedens sp.]|nr:nitroreductase [Candidatus Methanoperedens sp.]MCZ7370694.1 nitroreductase [Candidatus Methanoperedens sp.]
MNVTDALNSRYSTRAFRPDQVDKETILNILEAATRAPSWANTQPWEIFVAGGEVLNRIRGEYLANFQNGVPGKPDVVAPQKWPPAMKKRMEELGETRFNIAGIKRDDKAARHAIFEMNYKFFGASVVIYLCMDRSLTPWSIFDIGMLAQSIMLASQEHGLGSIPAYMLVSYPDLIRTELEIPEHLSIIIGIALGYSDIQHPQNKFRSPRRPILEVVRFKGFG